MNKKLIIYCAAGLAAMIAVIGIAVAFLYSGVESEEDITIPDHSHFMLLPAVPSDAVMVAGFSDAEDYLGRIYSSSNFAKELHIAADSAGVDLDAILISFHYVGKLQPLYVFEAGDSAQHPGQIASFLMNFAKSKGLHSQFVDGASTSVERKLSKHSVVLVSPSETLLKSSVRHMQKAVSVMDAPGFAAAADKAGQEVIFVSSAYAGKLITASMTRKYFKYADFIRKISDWLVFNIEECSDEDILFSGNIVSERESSKLLTALAEAGADGSELSKMIPSYTVSAISLPLKNYGSYVPAYDEFLDYAQNLQFVTSQRKNLKSAQGIAPVDFYIDAKIKEAAKVSFYKGNELQSVNLIKVSDPNLEKLFSQTDIKSLKGYTPQLHSYPLADFAAAGIGRIFSLSDETHFTYIDGWIVSGSEEAVRDYADGVALSYNLKEYMQNAGLQDLLSPVSAFTAYLSFSESDEALSSMFSKEFFSELSLFSSAFDYSGAVLLFEDAKETDKFSLRIFSRNIERSKAPVAERDVKVEIPTGPFKVKNSGTGKTNLFYQQENLYLCLQEEGGKGLWGVPFTKPICGAVHNVDFYANGKIQFLFGAGSEIYLIDRLGRFVKGFPFNTGKEILLGPDVYDFSGRRKYNIMVLHKDNTIEMYNLQGQKPASWKTISPSETITGLPERLELSGSTFWVVRTAVQTLIYPFMGGEPVTELASDQMAMPETEVTVIDGTTVEVKCYDGKKRKLKIK